MTKTQIFKKVLSQSFFYIQDENFEEQKIICILKKKIQGVWFLSTLDLEPVQGGQEPD